MKVDSVPGGVRRRPLIMSSMECWNRDSMSEGTAIDRIRVMPRPLYQTGWEGRVCLRVWSG